MSTAHRSVIGGGVALAVGTAALCGAARTTMALPRGRGAGGVAPTGGAKVYVGNLSYETTWQTLKDHFRTVGEVLHADVMMGKDGRSKGCGLVSFASAKDARSAISTLHDSELGGRLIFVREDREA